MLVCNLGLPCLFLKKLEPRNERETNLLIGHVLHSTRDVICEFVQKLHAQHHFLALQNIGQISFTHIFHDYVYYEKETV